MRAEVENLQVAKPRYLNNSFFLSLLQEIQTETFQISDPMV